MLRKVSRNRHEPILNRTVADVEKDVIQSRIKKKWMLAELVALELQIVVIGRLINLITNVAGPIKCQAIDVFDVRGSPPSSHERVSGRPSVFVGVNDAVLDRLAAVRLREALIPGK